jgi:hypothetical protein
MRVSLRRDDRLPGVFDSGIGEVWDVEGADAEFVAGDDDAAGDVRADGFVRGCRAGAGRSFVL